MFVERNEGVEFLIDGQKVTWFDPHKELEIRSGNTFVKISLISFGGDCTGLVLLGNRPGQLLQSEEIAFDWKVVCECIRGTIPETFSMRVEIGRR
jgi:hypothetical protein